MILYLENEKQIRGDLIISACLRSDLSPIPLTLEAEIRAGDETFNPQLAEGRTIRLESGEKLYIVKSVRVQDRKVEGERPMDGFQITALIEACLPVAYVRERAIIKENASLSAIYRAAGATIPGIISDFPVKRFYCYVGETPTFQIARVLQEEGGVVRWKNKKLEFLSLRALKQAKAVRTIPGNASDSVDGGFLVRHRVPWFFSLAEDASFLYGNQAKPRSVNYSPFKTEIQLRNMTRCIIHRKTLRAKYDQRICAGDVIQLDGGTKMIVITAAHVFSSGTEESGSSDQYSRLWLGEVDE